ncbi:hypothetical protein JVU11DRAFT_9754 [Chiua virens]|nr:hypothetical protein JVU11DRAFT_9754 [Chiua virens]
MDCIYLIQATIAMTHSFKGLKNFHEALSNDRKALPKKFLVVGHTRRRTEAVTQNLISEMKKVNIDLDVGSITIDIGADFRDMVSCGLPVEDRFITSVPCEQVNEDTS